MRAKSDVCNKSVKVMYFSNKLTRIKMVFLELTMSNTIQTTEQIRIVCPKCETHNFYEIIPLKSVYNFQCPNCHSDFESRIVKVRSKRSQGSKRDNRRNFSIRILDFSGSEDFIEFVNTGYKDFELRARDRAIFSYLKNDLKIVQNDTINHYMKVSKPYCFIATYLYGPKSEEVASLRCFRDDVLLSSALLSPLVNLYYLLSQTILKWLGNFRLFKAFSLFLMKPVVLFIGWYLQMKQSRYMK